MIRVQSIRTLFLLVLQIKLLRHATDGLATVSQETHHQKFTGFRRRTEQGVFSSVVFTSSRSSSSSSKYVFNPQYLLPLWSNSWGVAHKRFGGVAVALPSTSSETLLEDSNDEDEGEGGRKEVGESSTKPSPPPPPSSSSASYSQYISPAVLPNIDDEDDAWESALTLSKRPYMSSLLKEMDVAQLSDFFSDLGDDEEENSIMKEEEKEEEEDCLQAFLTAADIPSDSIVYRKNKKKQGGGAVVGEVKRLRRVDPLWEQIKLEATHALSHDGEVDAGPQLYAGILSQPTLLDAICNLVPHEIETELMPATALRNLFMEQLTPFDERCIALDIMAAAMRSTSVGTALTAVLFNKGVHALVCHRVAHRLWKSNRTGLAMYMQSIVSSRYSADIHPACTIGAGIYLNAGGGIVIGETAVVGDDVTILQGVTLGGTGKERGDRHPKIGPGVVLHDSSTVLGNIRVGYGAVVTAKSIVTKGVPDFARVAGVPAKITSYRNLNTDAATRTTATATATLATAEPGDVTSGGANSDLISCAEEQLRYRYLRNWESASSSRIYDNENSTLIADGE